MTQERLAYLYEKYKQKTCSYEELEEWFLYIQYPDARKIVEQFADKDLEENQQIVPSAKEIDWNFMFTHIIENASAKNAVDIPSRSKVFTIWKLAAAAVIILMLGGASFFVFQNNSGLETAKVQTNQNSVNDVAPGHEGAILTLSDGQVIVLDSAHNGVLAEQGNIRIRKKDGGINYEGEDSSAIVYNTMRTPNGRLYSLTLADGSRVWLNAASSITFPTAFTGNQRTVSITGEAYFEVVHNASKPFNVSVNGIDVMVLGTRFNINAYSDELLLKTTLLEGKVMVKRAEKYAVLHPGQQAITAVDSLSKNHTITVADNVDVDRVLAWKAGLFNFEHSDINKILREFARWYDVEVEYEGKVTEKEFFGIVSRNSTLASVLKALKFGGPANLSYKIEGKKLIVQSAKKN